MILLFRTLTNSRWLSRNKRRCQFLPVSRRPHTALLSRKWDVRSPRPGFPLTACQTNYSWYVPVSLSHFPLAKILIGKNCGFFTRNSKCLATFNWLHQYSISHLSFPGYSLAPISGWMDVLVSEREEKTPTSRDIRTHKHRAGNQTPKDVLNTKYV